MDMFTPRPISEWHEDIGPVLWWKFPIEEPPYVGTPLDLGQEVLLQASVPLDQTPNTQTFAGTFMVGGFPGYHTHWTPIPIPQLPESN